jgi:hypothetical protein
MKLPRVFLVCWNKSFVVLKDWYLIQSSATRHFQNKVYRFSKDWQKCKKKDFIKEFSILLHNFKNKTTLVWNCVVRNGFALNILN